MVLKHKHRIFIHTHTHTHTHTHKHTHTHTQTRLKITVGMFKMAKLSQLTNVHSNCKDDYDNKHVTQYLQLFSKCIVN